MVMYLCFYICWLMMAMRVYKNIGRNKWNSIPSLLLFLKGHKATTNLFHRTRSWVRTLICDQFRPTSLNSFSIELFYFISSSNLRAPSKALWWCHLLVSWMYVYSSAICVCRFDTNYSAISMSPECIVW